MSRLERPQQANPNPSKMFLEWKSEKKCFEYYDKEIQSKVEVQLPVKFAFLEHYHTVKGYNDDTNSGVYSNEVYSIGKEPVKVRTFSGMEIAEGIYKENKPAILAAGGKYHRSIYGVTESGQIINIALKGACVGGIEAKKSVSNKDIQGYSDFYNDNNSNEEHNWFCIKEFAEGKSGSVSYSIPVFSLGEKFTTEENQSINEQAKILQEYVLSRNESSKQEKVSAEIEMHEAVQELPPVESYNQHAPDYDPDLGF